MAQILKYFFTLVTIISVVSYGVYWRQSLTKDETKSLVSEDEALKNTKELIASSERANLIKAAETIDIFLSGKTPPMKIDQWESLFIETYTELKEPQKLLDLYTTKPLIFKGHEDAIFIIADLHILNKNFEEYDKLKNMWIGTSSQTERWSLFDASKLVVERKPEEAIKMLESMDFKGEQETERLVRLALLKLNENPNDAWKFLTEAAEKNPSNSSLRSIRAKVLESANKIALAQTEYTAAVYYSPDEPYFKNQLGEFYRRQKKYSLAINSWEQGLTEKANCYLWVKTWFWSRVAHPIKRNWAEEKIPEGRFKSLANYYFSIKNNAFFEMETFAKSQELRQFLNEDQSTYWLRILNNLQEKNYDKAAETLSNNPFQGSSWEPDLELNFKRILNYQKTGLIGFANEDTEKVQSHPFFHLLMQYSEYTDAQSLDASLPGDFKALLKSHEAFPAALTAAGWFEAAINLHEVNTVPSIFPTWFAYNMAQAIRSNRDIKEVLKYINKQENTQPLTLLKGETLISDKRHNDAIAVLSPLAKLDSNIGIRASWLISLIHLQNKRHQEAISVINENPSFASTLLGKETLAKAALVSGEKEKAKTLYLNIENESAEAKSYLAQDAFASKNWAKAKELTEQLLMKFPNNPTLQRNLSIILQIQEKTKTE